MNYTFPMPEQDSQTAFTPINENALTQHEQKPSLLEEVSPSQL